MYTVLITNKASNEQWGKGTEFETLAEANAWLDAQIGTPGKLPERKVPKLDEFGFVVVNDNGEVVSELIPAEYEAQVIDLSVDADFILSKVHEARKKEYPSELDVIEAIMEDKDGRPEKLALVTAKRLAVKAKYPKNVLPQKDS